MAASPDFRWILGESPACNSVCRVCHYKDLDYPTQLEKKQRWAETQLAPWGDLLEEIRPAPDAERIAYRAKSWMRSHFQNGALSFGMYRSVRVNEVWEKEFVSWDGCPIHVEAIQNMTEALRLALVKEVPQFSENSLLGVWLGSPHLVIVSKDPCLDEMMRLPWDRILVPPFDHVWFHRTTQIGRRIFGHEAIHKVVGNSPDSAHPIRAFRQVAQSLLLQARTRALEYLLRSGPEMVLDLYCGTGNLAMMLPPDVGWLGIEISKEAVEYANTLRKQGPAFHGAFVGTVEDRLRDPRVASKIRGPYALYINPPRIGLTVEARDRVLSVIQEQAPSSIVYLSCSASSLARDLKEFESKGYRVEFLQPYDFFPQTEHFEILACLRRSD